MTVNTSAQLDGATFIDTTYLISPGQYVLTNRFSFGSSQTCLIGLGNGPSDVIIKSASTTPNIDCMLIAVTSYVGLRNLTLDGQQFQCGLEIYGSSLQTEDVDFVSCYYVYGAGGGGAAYLDSNTQATFNRTTFAGNSGLFFGGAMAVYGASVVTLQQVSWCCGDCRHVLALQTTLKLVVVFVGLLWQPVHRPGVVLVRVWQGQPGVLMC